jgi:tetratricopeptide (TPR) repeat protein
MKGGSASAPSGTAAPPRPKPRKSTPPAKLAAAPAAPETPETPESPQKAGLKSPPARLSKPADDDPFAVDSSLVEKAIPVSPKPAQGRSLEVKCPMCETVGYVSQKAAGQHVKCLNPKCLVPIFTVPLPKKVAPPPPPPKKSSVPLYAGISVALLLVIGVAAWQFLSPPPPPPPTADPLPVGATGTGVPPATPVKGAGEPTVTEDPPEVAFEPEADMTRDSLRKLENLSVNVPTNRKAYCRRLTAIAYIDAGDLEAARKQLEQLQKIGAQTPYEGCLPNVWLAWREINQSGKAFTESVAEATRLADLLPPRGRYAIEAGLGTAAVVAAAGKPDAAQKILVTHQGPFDRRQIATASQAVQHEQTYDFDTPLIGRTLGDWLAPSETGVALILAANERWDDAEAWVKQMTDPIARAETALAWTEAFARRAILADPAADLARPLAVAGTLPPPVKARLLARLAAVRLAAGNQPAAHDLLQQAQQVVAALPPPQPIALDGAKAILDFKFPDATMLRFSALAAAEIALVQLQSEQPDAAWSNVELALRFLHGMTPGLGFADQWMSQLEGGAKERVRAELKSELSLKTDDQVRRALQQYSDKCKALHRAAVNRFVWQAEILEAVARRGLGEKIWNEVQVAEARPDRGEREPFLSSAVRIALVNQFRAQKQPELERKVSEAGGQPLLSQIPELRARVIAAQTADAIAAGDIESAVQQLNETLSASGRLHEWSLVLASRLVKGGKIAEAITLARGLRDVVLREDAIYFVSALAARTGHFETAWKLAAQLKSTESAAATAGIVAGLAHRAAPQQPPPAGAP